MPTADVVLAHLIRARALMLQHWRPDTCIASTAIALKVLDHYGIPAQPLVVRAGVYNATLWEHIVASNGEWPSPEEVESVRERGGWSVMLGWNPNPEHEGGVGSIDTSRMGWSGHLVAIVQPQREERRGLLDLSLDQATRPEKNIHTRPFLGDQVDQAFLEGNDQLIYTFSDWQGTVVVYQAYPGITSYEVSPDWADSRRHTRYVHTIIQRIDAEGAGRGRGGTRGRDRR